MQALIFDLDETLFAAEDTLHDGVQELLAIVRRLGVKIGAFTNGDHRMLVRLDEAGIRQHFDSVLCTAHVAEPKNPKGLSQLLGMLGTEPHHAALVSHAHSDIVLGKHAGVGRTIRVTHGLHSTQERQPAEADRIVEDIPSVLDVLE